MLMAPDDEHALGWHLCRAENSRAWSALMSRIAAPEVAVSDGGDGFAKALRETWPGTRHQRCVFHAFSQVRRYTTTRPRTPAGVELYGLARALLSVTTLREADGWVQALLAWSERWDSFLAETSVDESGKARLTHERLVKARRSLVRLVNAGTLFTYLDPTLTSSGPIPSTNNSIEGGVNARLRAMLRDHRGAVGREAAQGDLLVALHALSGPAPCRRDSARHAHGQVDRGHLREALRAGEARGGHPSVGRRDRVVGAPPLGALPNGLGLTRFLSYKPSFSLSGDSAQRISACERGGPHLTEKKSCAETVEAPILAPAGRAGAYS